MLTRGPVTAHRVCQPRVSRETTTAKLLHDKPLEGTLNKLECGIGALEQVGSIQTHFNAVSELRG